MFFPDHLSTCHRGIPKMNYQQKPQMNHAGYKSAKVCKLLGYYENTAENEDTTQFTQTRNNKLNIIKQSTEH